MGEILDTVIKFFTNDRVVTAILLNIAVILLGIAVNAWIAARLAQQRAEVNAMHDKSYIKVLEYGLASLQIVAAMTQKSEDNETEVFEEDASE